MANMADDSRSQWWPASRSLCKGRRAGGCDWGPAGAPGAAWRLVSVVIPRYRSIDLDQFGFKPFRSHLPLIPLGFENLPFDVHRGTLPESNVPVFLIGNDQFFDRDGIYLDVGDRQGLPGSGGSLDFFPAGRRWNSCALQSPHVDIIHCHDHQTGLIPGVLAELYRPPDRFRRPGRVHYPQPGLSGPVSARRHGKHRLQ